MPVLAEEAIGCATGIKDGQVVVSWVFTAFAHPIGDAVCWQRVAIPMQETACGSPSEVHELALPHRTQATVSALPFTNDALVTAQSALDAIRMARRLGWQIKGGSGIGMDRLYPRARGGESRAQAVGTDANGR